ncbi:maturation protein [ssRNA phage SRR5466725_7]|uniref:Maturation protein n=1 Tax=ssRNA phage SRR5466725_7 TaxID=2786426 RepID=A0A8S5L3Z7_9VIRU|nr:maturation protein [ssRNA phage SRR5466725_7]DAD52416.1 TPA_asm: maturation protein [ssRNA phage SRR5466725_7]
MVSQTNCLVVKTLSTSACTYECYFTCDGLFKGVVAARLQLRPIGPVYVNSDGPTEFNIDYIYGSLEDSKGRNSENFCSHLKYTGEAVARRRDENRSLVQYGTEQKLGISTGDEPVQDGRIFAASGMWYNTKKYYGPAAQTSGAFLIGPYSSTTGTYNPEGSLKEDTRKILIIDEMSGTYESRNLFWTPREGTTGTVTKVYQAITLGAVTVGADGRITATVTLETRTQIYKGSRIPNDQFPSTYLESDETTYQTRPARVLVRRFPNGISTYGFGEIALACRHISTSLMLNRPKLDSELAGKAIDSQIGSLSANNIENAVQLRKGPLPLDAIRKASRDMTGALASLYLWWRYVVKTSIKDFRELLSLSEMRVKQARAFSGKWIRARSADTLVTEIPLLGDVAWHRHFRIYFRSSFDGGTPLLRLRALGLHPGLAQAWDLIPYSFVKDWFFSVQDALKSIDDQIAFSSLRLGRGVYSAKCFEPLARFEHFSKLCGGSATIGYYYRTPHSYLPLTLDLKGVPVRQWWQAGLALCVANRNA